MDSDNDDSLEMFREPRGYFEPDKLHSFEKFALQSGELLHLRLVGHNPLWGHHLWQAARIVAKFLEDHSVDYLQHRTVLELGAAAALPSIVASRCGASAVVATDYPDADLISNIQHNLDHCAKSSSVYARGFLWGADPAPIKNLLSSHDAFDTLILADLLFNHSCHDALLKSLTETMKRAAHSVALVFFTPYRPWLYEKDMAFFDLVTANPELRVEKLGEWKMDKVMFQEDRGDESLRRTVFGYAVRWASWPPALFKAHPLIGNAGTGAADTACFPEQSDTASRQAA